MQLLSSKQLRAGWKFTSTSSEGPQSTLPALLQGFELQMGSLLPHHSPSSAVFSLLSIPQRCFKQAVMSSRSYTRRMVPSLGDKALADVFFLTAQAMRSSKHPPHRKAQLWGWPASQSLPGALMMLSTAADQSLAGLCVLQRFEATWYEGTGLLQSQQHLAAHSFMELSKQRFASPAASPPLPLPPPSRLLLAVG